MRRAVVAGWVGLAMQCAQPRTELVARVDSEVAWGVGAAVQSVTLSVRRGGPTGSLRSARTTALGTEGDRGSLPLSVGILPGDDTDTPVWIEALGCSDPNGCAPTNAVVAQRAVVRFTRGQTEEVPLLLASACVGVLCGSDERCGEGGRCEPATRVMVRPFDGIDAALVADITADAGDSGTVADAPATDLGSPVDRNDLGAMDAVVTVDVVAPDVIAADTVSTGDIAAPCGPLELHCGGACAPVLTDSANCGSCGNVCPMGGQCRMGTCVGGCPAGMRYVTADLFEMGSDLRSDERPRHVVQLSAFCLDETEVTVAAYGACVAAGRCSAATGFGCNASASDRGNHPVNCVDWSRASTYCRWRGGDLPTEAQWEYAARGTDGRTYPWGNDEPRDQLNFASAGTAPVRSFARDVSPFGLFDMGGNVSEWVSDWYGPYVGAMTTNPVGVASGTERVRRGGQFNTINANEVRAAYRYHDAPGALYGTVGFRCARAP